MNSSRPPSFHNALTGETISVGQVPPQAGPHGALSETTDLSYTEGGSERVWAPLYPPQTVYSGDQQPAQSSPSVPENFGPALSLMNLSTGYQQSPTRTGGRGSQINYAGPEFPNAQQRVPDIWNGVAEKQW